MRRHHLGVEGPARVAGKDYVVLMADMFGTGYGDKPKNQDQLRAGMLAVHKDVPFTIACGAKAYDTLMAEADKLGLARSRQDGPRSAIARVAATRSNRRAPARDFKAVVVFHVPSQSGRPRHALQHQRPGAGGSWPRRPDHAEADDGCARGRSDQGQGRLAHRDVRPRRALVLRPDRQRTGPRRATTTNSAARRTC